MAEVESRVTIGFLVMIWETEVFLGSKPSAVTYRARDQQDLWTGCRAHTLNARSFAVKIPLKPSSSSTTRTQSVLLAAQSWEASATLMPSGTVRAGEGLSPATVPLIAFFEPLLPPAASARLLLETEVPPRFLSRLLPIFFRRALKEEPILEAKLEVDSERDKPDTFVRDTDEWYRGRVGASSSITVGSGVPSVGIAGSVVDDGKNADARFDIDLDRCGAGTGGGGIDVDGLMSDPDLVVVRVRLADVVDEGRPIGGAGASLGETDRIEAGGVAKGI